jgi:hypothetical protein
MSVTVTSFIVSILAAYGLKYLSEQPVLQSLKDNKNLLYLTGGFLALGLIVLLLSPGFSYTFVRDSYEPRVLEIIKTARKELLSQDLIRYFILVILGTSAIFAYMLRKISFNIMMLALSILILFDLIDVQSRYEEKYTDIKKIEKQYFAKTATDNFLSADKEIFRVFPAGRYFGDNRWAYHHQTIGGYSAIKMYTIEEMIGNNLYKGWDKNFPVNFNMLKILNTKYVITEQKISHEKLDLVLEDSKTKNFTYLYKERLPRGFFVGETKIIADEYERLKEINKKEFDPAFMAILEEPLSENIHNPDSSWSKVTSFNPNEIHIDTFTDKQSLFVISEMYYPPGWKVLLDNQPVEKIYKTNHAIMSFVVPSGKHKIQLSFDPDSFSNNIKISYASAGILYIIVILSLILMFKEKLPIVGKKNDSTAEVE